MERLIREGFQAVELISKIVSWCLTVTGTACINLRVVEALAHLTSLCYLLIFFCRLLESEMSKLAQSRIGLK